MSKQAVTVIGLGPMGQAMVGAFLDNGHPVTVWNRTASKADALVAKGATRATTVAEALAANELVILSLTDYDAMYAILEQAEDALAGRVVVNLSSDTPKRAREGAEWVNDRGARYITGGVMVPPPMIGTPEAKTYYSGPKELFEAHQDTLKVLTSTDYRGADPGLGALHYQIQIALFWSTVMGFAQAAAMADAYDIPVSEILPDANAGAAGMDYFFNMFAEEIAGKLHLGDLASADMEMASIEHVVHASTDAGVDATLPTALAELFRRRVDAGREAGSSPSLFDVIKRPAA